MITTLTDTTASAVDKTMTEMRETFGENTIGRVLTLIIIATGDIEEPLEAAIAASHEHPARVLVVDADPEAETSGLDAEIRVGRDAGAGEIVILHARGDVLWSLDTLVMALLLPDAPIVTWWPENAPSSPVHDVLGSMSQRRITDSAACADPLGTLKRLRRGYASGDSDFAWARLTRWRGLVASAYEVPPVSVPSSVEVLGTASLPPNSFTQGLETDPDGNLLLGTGQWGESRIERFSPETGETLAETRLDSRYFGEGITQDGDSIWQLTWKSGQALKYDHDLRQVDTATYSGEGWGLCNTGEDLLMSDGSATLRHMDPETFAERSTTDVTLEGKPLEDINELECVGDAVYANVWMDDNIYRINPSTGRVTAVISTDAIDKSRYTDPDDVLNGIAHIKDDEFWLTGKRWEELFHVRVR